MFIQFTSEITFAEKHCYLPRLVNCVRLLFSGTDCLLAVSAHVSLRELRRLTWVVTFGNALIPLFTENVLLFTIRSLTCILNFL